MLETKDDESIVDEYPDPATLPKKNWQGVDIDDDVVVSHGDSVMKNKKQKTVAAPPVDHKGGTNGATTSTTSTPTTDETQGRRISFFALLAIGFFAYAIKRVFFTDYNPLKRSQYSELGTSDPVTMAV